MTAPNDKRGDKDHAGGSLGSEPAEPTAPAIAKGALSDHATGDVSAANAPGLQRSGRLLESDTQRAHILKTLGAGGNSTVYLVQLELGGHKEVWKFVPMRDRKDGLREREEELQERVENEVLAAGPLSEVTGVVVPTRPVWKKDRTGMFLPMEAINGKDLGRKTVVDGPMNVASVVESMISVAGTLEDCHRAVGPHRDIKPQNIVLGRIRQEDVRTYLIDFGIGTTGAEHRGNLGYTPYYSAPEQVLGDHPSRSDWKGRRVPGTVDVWSLGVTTFYLLTGRLPFLGVIGTHDPAQVYRQLETCERRTIRDELQLVDAEMDQILSKAMSWEAADRHRSPAEFAEELERCYYEPSDAKRKEEARVPKVHWQAADAFFAGDAKEAIRMFRASGRPELADLTSRLLPELGHTRRGAEEHFVAAEAAGTSQYSRLNELLDFVRDLPRWKTGAIDRSRLNQLIRHVVPDLAQNYENAASKLSLQASWADLETIITSMKRIGSNRLVRSLLDDPVFPDSSSRPAVDGVTQKYNRDRLQYDKTISKLRRLLTEGQLQLARESLQTLLDRHPLDCSAEQRRERTRQIEEFERISWLDKQTLADLIDSPKRLPKLLADRAKAADANEADRVIRFDATRKILQQVVEIYDEDEVLRDTPFKADLLARIALLDKLEKSIRVGVEFEIPRLLLKAPIGQRSQYEQVLSARQIADTRNHFARCTDLVDAERAEQAVRVLEKINSAERDLDVLKVQLDEAMAPRSFDSDKAQVLIESIKEYANCDPDSLKLFETQLEAVTKERTHASKLYTKARENLENASSMMFDSESFGGVGAALKEYLSSAKDLLSLGIESESQVGRRNEIRSRTGVELDRFKTYLGQARTEQGRLARECVEALEPAFGLEDSEMFYEEIWRGPEIQIQTAQLLEGILCNACSLFGGKTGSAGGDERPTTKGIAASVAQLASVTGKLGNWEPMLSSLCSVLENDRRNPDHLEPGTPRASDTVIDRRTMGRTRTVGPGDLRSTVFSDDVDSAVAGQ